MPLEQLGWRSEVQLFGRTARAADPPLCEGTSWPGVRVTPASLRLSPSKPCPYQVIHSTVPASSRGPCGDPELAWLMAGQPSPGRKIPPSTLTMKRRHGSDPSGDRSPSARSTRPPLEPTLCRPVSGSSRWLPSLSGSLDLLCLVRVCPPFFLLPAAPHSLAMMGITRPKSRA